jgi:hypothetical protein
VDSFRFLAESYDEILFNKEAKENVLEYISHFKEEYSKLMSLIPEKMQDKLSRMKTSSSKSFREKIYEQAEKRRDKQSNSKKVNRVKTIDGKIVFIKMKDILAPQDQLRKNYNPQSIDALAIEMSSYGQIKPGLLLEQEIDGKKKYRLIYGHTRYLAAKKAGLKYYKTFVRDNLNDLEISILQAVEDLSESDSPVERAKVLNKHYNLNKLKSQLAHDKLSLEEKSEKEYVPYTKEDFVKEYSHLGSRKVLKDALEFMELEDNLRGMVASKLISYESSLKIGKLSKEHKLSLLYSTMASHVSTSELDAKIKLLESNKHQMKMFEEVPKSYEAILSLFKNQLYSPISYMKQTLAKHQCIRDKVLDSIDTFENYVSLYDSVLALEKIVYSMNDKQSI